MYYPDLTPYIRHEYEKIGTIRIGWLDARYPHEQAKASEEFAARLFEFCQTPVMRMRGFHECEYCSLPPMHMIKAERSGVTLGLGNAEVRVVHGGQVYAAPTLIYHYVVEHDYKPPAEFVEAVLQGPLPGTPQYDEVLQRILDLYDYRKTP